MLCGLAWQPTRLDRVVQTFATSTRVAKVATDQGLAYIKGIGNPAGLGSLASELVCAELGARIGLEVPDFAIVEVADLEIPMQDHGCVQLGPAFASREILARTADGTDTYLRSLRSPADLAKLVMFDTWVRNADRCPPEGAFDPEPRYENLIFRPVGKKYDLIALDHTHCFTDGDIEHDIGDQAIVDDEKIYGLFAEFGPFIVDAHIHQAATLLRQIDAAFVEDVVRSIPMEWGITGAARARWSRAIIARSQKVADYLPAALAQQLHLGI